MTAPSPDPTQPRGESGAAVAGQRVWIAAIRAPKGWGIRVGLGFLVAESTRPVGIETWSGLVRRRWLSYSRLETTADVLLGRASLQLRGGVHLQVTDRWAPNGDGMVRIERSVAAFGDAPGIAVATAVVLHRQGRFLWRDVEPFSPGLIYGNCEPVPRWSIGSPESRRRGVRWIVARTDRMAAPLFVVRYADDAWLAILQTAPAPVTVAADGDDVEGSTLVDHRLALASLGGFERDERLELGLWLPGVEGEVTYTSGGLPLRQHRRWRRRYVPVQAGPIPGFSALIRSGTSADTVSCWRDAWGWAWGLFRPRAAAVDVDEVVSHVTSVLSSRVTEMGVLAGIPLEVDATTGRTVGARLPALMGFVGANTDAAEVLLRVSLESEGDARERYRRQARAILDTFANLDLDPPVGEGFDLMTGQPTTYRRLATAQAVYARSIAEGCLAALTAARVASRALGWDAAKWRDWALHGAAWLVSQQTAQGGIPRAWQARSGRILDSSTSATHTIVPLLAEVAIETGDKLMLDGAIRAAEYAWSSGGRNGCFAGATLDNPNVVDKEAAVFALESSLKLLELTGDRRWIERATVAASVAETWILIRNIPMPDDADDRELHWKRGVPTVGMQLITTGASMLDGYLAVNAAAFARLAEITGEEHWIEVARLVTHGTKAMLALPGRTYDLAGPGWQQEHWSFSTRRGQGLNRYWLPWVAVAAVKGILRLREEVPGSAEQVLK